MKKVKKGQVGFVWNKDLNIPRSGGHYVYIREVNGTHCEVNVVTSLEDKNKRFHSSRIDKVRRGMIYPIPKTDANFPLWSGITLNPKNVELDKIIIGNKSSKLVGDKTKREIKRRHHFMIGKYYGDKKNRPPKRRATASTD